MSQQTTTNDPAAGLSGPATVHAEPDPAVSGPPVSGPPVSGLEVRPIEILVVDDSPADVRLTKEALHDAKVRNILHVAENGVEALEFLHQRGPYSDVPRPDLILLDLNLPKMSGQEVLEQIKADASLAIIPVVILTTSEAEQDIVRSYQLRANCYITKPVDLDQFITVVKSIEDFWLTIVTLPEG